MRILLTILTVSSIRVFAQTDCTVRLSPIRITPIHQDMRMGKKTEAASVELVGEPVKGDHGGELSVLQRKENAVWMSTYVQALTKNDAQGDPRLFAYTFGNRAAYFFGFREIDDHTITIPNVAEFNGALKKVNQALVQRGEAPIPLSFVEVDGIQEARNYLFDLATNKKLASAAKGHERIHDLLHFSAIALPPAVLEYHYLQIERFLQFVDWVNQEWHHRLDLLWLIDEQFTYAMEIIKSLHPDFGTGNVTLIKYSVFQAPSTQDLMRLIETSIYNPLLGNGRSADEALRLSVIAAYQCTILGKPDADEKREKLKKILNEFFTTFPDPKYQRRFSLTGKITNDLDLSSTEPEVRKILEEEVTELWRQISERRGKIAAAVAQIK